MYIRIQTFDHNIIMRYDKCTVKPTVSAIVIHQNDFPEQVLWSVGDDTSYCPLKDRKSLINVD